MPDYSKAKVYKLINSVDDNIYIGSTCNTLYKRKYKHKQDAIRQTNRRVYKHLNDIGWENVSIILIEECPCDNRNQLLRREDYHIQSMKPELNSRIATDTCPHRKRQSQCVECDGAGICIHKKQRQYCKECDGTSICIHKRIRHHCRECGGTSLCIHKRDRYYCRECNGDKYRCLDCDIVLSSNRSLTNHYKSKRHLNKLKTKTA